MDPIAGSKTLSFLKELFVEQEDEQVNVDFGLIEHLHDGHPFILQLEKVLGRKNKKVKTSTHSNSKKQKCQPLGLNDP